ncbi:glutathione peroxidase [Shewanella salipaludis]|uniref:Glutathione peroxidase n=1 Tax=Shewanella salipaludis TaxID=2723052 RepID=A0A972JK11_9GAMM|nr:glutathione peroxidase [Shewanella salipaludis]NMH64629.1 glutathione peroxidase [Shewanella salipaludis]
MTQTIYDFSVTDIQGNQVAMEQFRNKVLLIVNTASQCGFTPQYKALEALYRQYREQGLVILGFPCNQFGAQEQAAEQEIQSFCELNFGVTFPLFAKIEVNGQQAHPLYQYLKSRAKGVLGTEKIKWNFTKFLVDGQGKVVARFAPTTKPESLAPKIAALLKR